MPSSSCEWSLECLYLPLLHTPYRGNISPHQAMKTKLFRIVIGPLVAFLIAVGCSKPSADTSKTTDESESPEVAGKKMTKETDEMVEEILKGTDKMEAADWLKRYPQSAIGENEEGQALALAPVVASLKQAGAKRVVIEYVTLGQNQFLVAMIVVLPPEPPARQKLFALEPKLRALCQQTPVIDRGQKYLYYSFD